MVGGASDEQVRKLGFVVLAERCGQCLYGKDKIVSNARRANIIRGLTKDDGHFICHKATILGRAAACRGDWDQRCCGQLGRIAGRLDMVTFVAESDLVTLPMADGLTEERVV